MNIKFHLKVKKLYRILVLLGRRNTREAGVGNKTAKQLKSKNNRSFTI